MLCLCFRIETFVSSLAQSIGGHHLSADSLLKNRLELRRATLPKSWPFGGTTSRPHPVAGTCRGMKGWLLCLKAGPIWRDTQLPRPQGDRLGHCHHGGCFLGQPLYSITLSWTFPLPLAHEDLSVKFVNVPCTEVPGIVSDYSYGAQIVHPACKNKQTEPF